MFTQKDLLEHATKLDRKIRGEKDVVIEKVQSPKLFDDNDDNFGGNHNNRRVALREARDAEKALGSEVNKNPAAAPTEPVAKPIVAPPIVDPAALRANVKASKSMEKANKKAAAATAEPPKWIPNA